MFLEPFLTLLYKESRRCGGGFLLYELKFIGKNTINVLYCVRRKYEQTCFKNHCSCYDDYRPYRNDFFSVQWYIQNNRQDFFSDICVFCCGELQVYFRQEKIYVVHDNLWGRLSSGVLYRHGRNIFQCNDDVYFICHSYKCQFLLTALQEQPLHL